MEYPKYVSHKEVGAVKIASVDRGADGSVTLYLEGGFANVIVTHHDLKHKPVPEAGWYLIQYADGYLSFSPASQFEAGYTLQEQVVSVEDPTKSEEVPEGDEPAPPGDPFPATA